MKCLVECRINQNAPPGERSVELPGYEGLITRVPQSACRMLDGSPIADDWPPIDRSEGYTRYPKLDGLVEGEIVESPAKVQVRFGAERVRELPCGLVMLFGSKGKPVYQLAVVGEVPGG